MARGRDKSRDSNPPVTQNGLFGRIKDKVSRTSSTSPGPKARRPGRKKSSNHEQAQREGWRGNRHTTNQEPTPFGHDSFTNDHSHESDTGDNHNRSASDLMFSKMKQYQSKEEAETNAPPRMPSSDNPSQYFHMVSSRAFDEAESSRALGGPVGRGSVRFGGNKEVYSQTLAAVSNIEQLAQKKGAQHHERFKVMPDDAYPNTFFNREELRSEMNKKSAYFHDLRLPNKRGQELGQLRLEILQCFGIPTSSLVRETQAYCVAVCGSHAFKTDVMPPVANPMWLCRMRRACLFPIHHAYARLFVGCFDDYTATSGSSTSDFAGRVVIDIARLRPDCTYDITLPLRQSAHIFTREQQGSIRLRFHLQWNNERAAILSYIPKKKPKFVPNETAIIHCLDERSFKNVAQVVHGVHMPGKFSMSLLKATIREINFTRIHIFRYMKKRELYNLRSWVYPFISGFVFCAWMHCVIVNSVAYVPGHFITFLLLHMYKNYAYYSMDSPLNNGFMPPTIEELFTAVFRPKKSQRSGRKICSIEPLNMERDDTHAVNPMDHMDAQDDYSEANPEDVPLHEIAESMRKSLRVKKHKHRLKTYHNCFLGTEAVDFLVAYGFAYSRDEAVELGRKLAKEAKLFQHVAKKHDLEDKPYFYFFLEYDTKKYVIKGHNVRGKKLFQAIGFIPEDPIDEETGHVEFPFATGADHPRFTVKQSLVIRSGEAKRLLQQEQLEKDAVDCAEFGVNTLAETMNEDGNETDEDVGPPEMRDSMAVAKSNSKSKADLMHADEAFNAMASVNQQNLHDKFEYDSDEDVDDIKDKKYKGYIIEEKILKKPPNQDMQAKKKGGEKPFTKVLEDARHKLHGVLLHMYNDRVYKLDDKLFPTTTDAAADKEKEKKERELLSKSKKTGFSRMGKEEKKKKKEKAKLSPYDARKDEYDRLLQINKYSHANPWINRVAVIVQPIVEMAQEWLCFFRSLFNIFTWQDPIMSFWIALWGPFLILTLHLAPWRYILGAAGVLFVGPQNYLIRMYKESRPGYEPPDFDKIIKKKKPPKEEVAEEIPYFSSDAPGNRLLLFKNIDQPMARQVVVPYGQMKYQRFYDWPPENDYARVYASPPPRNDFGDGEEGENFMYETAYWFDPTLSRKETKKQKEGMKKFASGSRKAAIGSSKNFANIARTGTNKVVGGTAMVTKKAVGGTAMVTKKAVGGTAMVTKRAAQGVTRRVSQVTPNMVKHTAGATAGFVVGATQKTGGVVKGATQGAAHLTAGAAKGAAHYTTGAVKGTANLTAGAVMGTANLTAGAVKGTAGFTVGAAKGAAHLTAGAVRGTAGFTTGAVMKGTKAIAGAGKGALNLGLRQRKGGSKRHVMSYDSDSDAYQASESDDE